MQLNRTFQAVAAHKLPCLYLVDSIIKNVGAPYIEHISKCVVRMFTNTFSEVIKSKPPKSTWNSDYPSFYVTRGLNTVIESQRKLALSFLKLSKFSHGRGARFNSHHRDVIKILDICFCVSKNLNEYITIPTVMIVFRETKLSGNPCLSYGSLGRTSLPSTN